jgi:hypothetical protein
MEFKVLALKVRTQRKLPEISDIHTTLCFDPGHTTGWAAFSQFDLISSGEIDTDDMSKATHEVELLISEYQPDVIVIEDYRVYKWRAKHHAGSDMLTTRVIGCIETLAIMCQIPHIVKQPAHIAKGFCKDIKLREWDMYQKGHKHARDAIRHGCYFLLFGAIKKADRARLTVG